MGRRVLNINIPGQKFEIGTPSEPTDFDTVKASGLKIKPKVRAEYKDYVEAAKRAEKGTNITKMDVQKLIARNGNFIATLDYDDSTPNTYKFLGMDINEKFEAVIPVGDGYVIVAHMFNREEICNSPNRLVSRYSDADIKAADNFIKSSSDVMARRLATAMKSGLIYDIYTQVKKNSASETTNIAEVKPLVDLVKKTPKSAGIKTGYMSILLTLVHEKAREDSKIPGSGEESTIIACAIFKIFDYWKRVIDDYCSLHAALSEFDLWANLGKKIYGEREFLERMRSSACVLIEKYDPVNGNLTECDEFLIPTGVARNGNMVDSNIFRKSCDYALTELQNPLSGTSGDVSYQDLLLGNIDYEKYDDAYSLSEAEIQAASIVDGLQHADETAEVAMDSYDMNDPDERALFLKSAIRSYERKFRDYKPQESYDVTDAMAEMIEKGDRFENRLMPEVEYDDERTYVFVVTDTRRTLNIRENKKKILKTGKMVKKILTPIVKSFK